MMKSYNKSHKFRRLRDRYYPYALVAPIVITFLAGGIVPIIYSFILSLMKYKMNTRVPPSFIGLKNYISVFSDDVFLSRVCF